MQRCRKTCAFVWICIMLAGIFGIGNAVAGHPAASFIYYELGVFSFEAQDYPEAAGYLEKAVAKRPDDAFAMFYLARTYLRQGRFGEAKERFRSARDIDPEIPGLAYDMGVLYQKIEDHDHALALFESVLAEDPDHVTALYHAGTSLFMMGRYREAIDYLLRASDRSRSVSPSARYYAGISNFRLSEFSMALPHFDYAASVAESPELRRDAEQWAIITRMQIDREKPWRVYAKAGWFYDDNVKLSPPDYEPDVGEDEALQKEGDHAAQLFISGRYVASLQGGLGGGRLDAGVGYSHYQTFYQDLGDYNLIGSIGEVFLESRVDRFTASLAYLPAYYWMDTDSYLVKHRVRPELRVLLSEADEIGFSYSYARNNYFIAPRRDGHTHTFILNYLRGFAAVDGHAFFGIGYQDNTASHPDEYFTELTLRAGVSVGFYERFRIRVRGDVNDKNYDNRDSYHDCKRDDIRYGASAVLFWQPFADWFNVSLEYTHTRNDSNIDVYEYRRNTYGLFFAADF